MKTQILFSPDQVEKVLVGLPSVAALLPDPAVEGVASEAFPGGLRKTEREAYRWLGNTHYDHLADAVLHLERVHAAGCSFGDLLTTRDRERFISVTSEVLVADDLLDRGYEVHTVERSGDVSPDLLVKADGIDVAVEVYSPRELLAVDEWGREVSDLLSYADVPASYASSVDTKFEQVVPPGPERLDPWAPAKILGETREEVLAEIGRDVEAALTGLMPLEKTYRHPGTTLLTTVEVTDVREAPDEGPARTGAISYPGFGGYSPAGVFRTVVKRALRKAAKRQVEGVGAGARVLVVYLMQTKIAEDLLHPAHMGEAELALREIEPRDYGLDVIAFVVRALPKGLAAVFMVADDAMLTEAQVQAMFGPSTEGASA